MALDVEEGTRKRTEAFPLLPYRRNQAWLEGETGMSTHTPGGQAAPGDGRVFTTAVLKAAKIFVNQESLGWTSIFPKREPSRYPSEFELPRGHRGSPHIGHRS